MSYYASHATKKIKEQGLQRAVEPLRFIMHCIEIITAVAILGGIVALYFGNILLGILMIFGALVFYGIEEFVLQKRSTIVRIYGPLGRIRYIFEQEFRDKFLQYFNKRNMDGRPIPRIVRDYIYQRAKFVSALSSFGSELDIDDVENTVNARLLHNNFGQPATSKDFKAIVGEHRKEVKPFEVINTMNVSAMSYGALNCKAAESLSNGADGVAFVNTGEGGYGPHGVAGNDTVFQIGTGKFGVGESTTLNDGTEIRKLNEHMLVDLVKQHDNIKMI